jgi:hypothetical protein
VTVLKHTPQRDGACGSDILLELHAILILAQKEQQPLVADRNVGGRNKRSDNNELVPR